MQAASELDSAYLAPAPAEAEEVEEEVEADAGYLAPAESELDRQQPNLTCTPHNKHKIN